MTRAGGATSLERHQTTQPKRPPPHLIAPVQRNHKERATFPQPTEQGTNMGKLASIVKPKTNGCIFGDIIDRYAEDDDDRAAIINPDVTAVAVWKFVTQEWESVSQTTVKEHRAKNCSCYRAAV